jgi:hypothetical protein
LRYGFIIQHFYIKALKKIYLNLNEFCLQISYRTKLVLENLPKNMDRDVEDLIEATS